MMHRAIWLSANAFAALQRAARPISAGWLRFARLAALRSRVCQGVVPVTTQFDGPVRANGPLCLTLGEHCRFGASVFLETCEGGRLTIGAHVRINMGSMIVAHTRVTIGDHCLIGEYVSIRDADHGLRPGPLMRLQPHTATPITIGDDVWIARGAVILKGVTIGSGAVVGANSVVTRDVPEMSIVAGVPARLMRRRDAGLPRTASACEVL